MKLLILATLVLAAAAAHFGLRGWPAWAAAGGARQRLVEREARLVAVTAGAEVISYAEVEDLEQACNDLARDNQERHANLLDASLAPELPALQVLLEDPELTALGPLRSELASRPPAPPLQQAALARFIALLEGYDSVRLRSLEPTDGGDGADLEGTELAVEPVELVVTADLPDALDLLESFAPGQGEPVIWVRRATLQRIEPPDWKLSAPEASGAPVRLAVSASVLFGPPGRP